MIDEIPREVGYSEEEKEILKCLLANDKNSISMIYTVKNEFPEMIENMKCYATQVGFNEIEISKVYQYLKILKGRLWR